MLYPLLEGIILGFGLVVPLGPQNAFIFQNAMMQRKFRSTLPAVLVSAICDCCLIIGAILSITLLETIAQIQFALTILGIGFLSFLSYKLWIESKSINNNYEPIPLKMGRQIIYTLSVSLLNPHAILDTFCVIGTVSSNYIGLEKQLFATGCVAVDFLWFLTLAILGFYLKKINTGTLLIRLTYRISAVVMLAVAISLTIKLLK